MTFFNSKKSKKLTFSEFYEKTGIRLTNEPLGKYPRAIEDEMDELYHLSREKPHKAIPRLERLLERYPNVPAIKNFLYISYHNSGQDEKAKAMLERTLQEHPDYLFAIVPKILSLKSKEELEKYGHLLGIPRDIRTIQPNEKVYHISAFAAYESAAAHYEAFTGDHESAVKRLQTLIELDVEQEKLEDVARHIATARVISFMDRHSEEKKYSREVESVSKVEFEPTEEPPLLECQELEIFYSHSLKNIDQETVARLMQLPRAALIRDLERVLEDSIRLWDYFAEADDYDDDTHSFPVHALYFLGALKAEESLQKVLDLLRMDSEFTDYWFGDSIDFIMLPTLFELGKNQLEQLKNFVLEPDLDDFNRLQVSKAVAQVALHHPERRAEVVGWFESVFNYLMDHEDDDRLMDTNFIGFSVAEVIHFNGLELLPLIEKLWNKKLIIPSIAGNLESIIKDLNEPLSEYYKQPLPENIHEYYSEEYSERRAPMPEKQQQELDKLINLFETEAEQMVNNHWAELMGFRKIKSKSSADSHPVYDDEEPGEPSFYTPPKQVKREAPKVGRNDPCPCSSGKKYKKCCMSN